MKLGDTESSTNEGVSGRGRVVTWANANTTGQVSGIVSASAVTGRGARSAAPSRQDDNEVGVHGPDHSELGRSAAPSRPLQTTTLGNTTKRLTRKISAAFSSDVEAAVLKASKPKYTAPKEKYVLTLLAALQGCGEAFFYLLDTAQNVTATVGNSTGGARQVASNADAVVGGGRASSSAPTRRTSVAVMSSKPQYGLNKVSTFHVQRLPHHRYRYQQAAPWPADSSERAEEVATAMERVMLCGDIVRKLWRHGMEHDWRIVCKVLMVAHRLMRDAATYADSIVFRLWAVYYDLGQRAAQPNETETDSIETETIVSQRVPVASPLLELLSRLVLYANSHSPRGQRERPRRLVGRGGNPSSTGNAVSILSSDGQGTSSPLSAQNLTNLETSRTRPEATACSLFVRHYAKYLWVRLESFRLLYLGERQRSSIVAELGDSFSPPTRPGETTSHFDEMGVVSSASGEELRERIPFERALGEVIPVLLLELESATAVRLETVLEAAMNPAPNTPSSENMASVNVHNEIIMEAARLIVHDVMQLFTTTNILVESVLEQQLFLGSNHLKLMRQSRALYIRFVEMTSRVHSWLERISRCMLGFEFLPANDARNRRRALGNAAADAMIRGELEHAPLDLIERGWWANLSNEERHTNHEGPGRPEDGRIEAPSRSTKDGSVPTSRRSRSERTYSVQVPSSGCVSSLGNSISSDRARDKDEAPSGPKHELVRSLERASSMKDIVKSMESILLGGASVQEQASIGLGGVHRAAQAVERELQALDEAYESCKNALEQLYNTKRAEILARPIQALSVASARRPSV
ncbi:hypothetical protein F1559_004218 [Cyanidiococcus yangmingshanensis]|uniref:ENTH domain-containing protein n=1 Tax=Cyanidiococcus yangmingshanensis TaxID=2690220 RepID=A0A7J7ILP1_9RHOD|nr:hypothetical protein F1559_004218 [Cyanidiococcus yangmingshanensis]